MKVVSGLCAIVMALQHTFAMGAAVSHQAQIGVRQPQTWPPRGAAPAVPGAFLAKIGKTIAESLQRLKSGSQELFSNAQKLGPLRKRYAAGEELSFEEFNLMQRTSGDCAKAVGLTLFIFSKPELAPFLCSFFPQVVPTTYLTMDEKVRRCQLKNFQRIRGVVQHLMNLQQETVGPEHRQSDRVKHLRTLERVLHAQDKGVSSALGLVDPLLFSPVDDSPKRGKGKKRPPRADLRDVPRPLLVAVCNSIGMTNRFIPAAGLRFLLSDYLERVRESDRVLLRSNLDKVGLEDLLDACSQRAVSLGDLSPGAMRKNLRAYLNTVSRPPVRSPKGDQELNDSNLRFALLGFNMANLVRDAQENSGLRALFGCRTDFEATTVDQHV